MIPYETGTHPLDTPHWISRKVKTFVPVALGMLLTPSYTSLT